MFKKLHFHVIAKMKRAVQYGLKRRKRPPVHVISIDAVSRRKEQVYLTVVYDLERRVLLLVGEDHTEEAVRSFSLRNGQTALSNASGSMQGHVGAIRQAGARSRGQRETPPGANCGGNSPPRKESPSREPVAAAEEPVESEQRPERTASTLVRWNSPLVHAWYLKESFQLFWTYRQSWCAKQHLLK
jgi:hypothetical protein